MRSHAGGQLLHLAKTALHLFQALGNQLEGVAQACFQRRLQLFVHGVAHLLQLLRIVVLQRAQLLFQRGAHLGDALFVALGQFLQAQAKAFGQALLRLRTFLTTLARIVHQGLAQRAQLGIGPPGEFLQLLAEGVDARFLLLAEGFQLAAQFLQALPHECGATLLALRRLGTRLAGVLAQRLAQQVQALVGAGGQIGQRAGKAIELFAQLAAPGARLLTHRLFEAVVRRAAQQGDKLQDEHGQ